MGPSNIDRPWFIGCIDILRWAARNKCDEGPENGHFAETGNRETDRRDTCTRIKTCSPVETCRRAQACCRVETGTNIKTGKKSFGDATTANRQKSSCPTAAAFANGNQLFWSDP